MKLTNILNHCLICDFQGTEMEKTIKFSPYQLLSLYFVFDSYSLRALVCLRLNSNFAYRLVFVKFSGNGDGEIRTLDPLLARQVLSQLSYTPINSSIHLLSHIVSNIVPSAV